MIRTARPTIPETRLARDVVIDSPWRQAPVVQCRRLTNGPGYPGKVPGQADLVATGIGAVMLHRSIFL